MSDMPLPLFSAIVVTALVGLMVAYSLIWERGPHHPNPLLWEDEPDAEDVTALVGLMVAYSLIWERGPHHPNPLLWEDEPDAEDCSCSFCALERLSRPDSVGERR